MKVLADAFIRWQRKDFAKIRGGIENRTVPSDVTCFHDIPYTADGSHAHTLDIYMPEKHGTDLPVVINIHGGGLITGSKEFNRPMCIVMARAGFLVYAVEYRVCPENTIDELLHDVLDAEAFILMDASERGGDPEKLMITADSGGGYPALYTSVMLNSLNFAERMGMKDAVPKGHVIGLGLISPLLYTAGRDVVGSIYRDILYGKNMHHEALRRFSDPEDVCIVSHLPPVWLATSRGDPFQKDVQKYAAFLRKQGLRTELADAERKDLGHAYAVFEPDRPETGELLSLMISFLKSL